MGEVGIHRVLQGVRYIMCIHTTPTTGGLSWITDMENYDFTTSLKEAAVICQNVW